MIYTPCNTRTYVHIFCVFVTTGMLMQNYILEYCWIKLWSNICGFTATGIIVLSDGSSHMFSWLHVQPYHLWLHWDSPRWLYENPCADILGVWKLETLIQRLNTVILSLTWKRYQWYISALCDIIWPDFQNCVCVHILSEKQNKK